MDFPLIVLLTLGLQAVRSDPYDINVIVLEDDSSPTLPFGWNRSMPAVNLAEEHVKILYRDYINFTFIYEATPCDGEGTGALAAKLYCEKSIGVFIGPGCTPGLEVLGKLTKTWNIPIISPVGSGISTSEAYSLVTKLSPYSVPSYVHAIVAVLIRYNWHNVVIIYDEYSSTSKMLQDGLADFLGASLEFTHTSFQFSSQAYKSDDLRQLLIDASSRARVFLILCHVPESRALMLEARDLGYATSGDYVFFLVTNSSQIPNQSVWKTGKTDDKLYLEALGHALFPYVDKFANEDTNFTAEVVRRSWDKYKYDFGNRQPSHYISSYYDSVMVFATVLNETLAEGGDALDGYKITRKIWNHSFKGVHVQIRINDKGFRQSDMTFGYFDIITGQLMTGIFYDYETNSTSIPLAPLPWPYSAQKGVPPPNQPPCGGFDNGPCESDDLSDELIGAVSGVVAFLLIGSAVAAVVVYRTWKKNNQTDLFWWRIGFNELILVTATGASSMSLKSSKNSLKNISTFIDGSSEDSRNTNFAIWKGQIVQIRKLPLKQASLTKAILLDFKMLRDVNHSNLVRIVGACLEDSLKALVIEQCAKGSLQDLLGNTNIKLDAQFKFSLCTDIINGICYIHTSPIRYHGRLKSEVCLIDNRFSVKLTDYGLPTLFNDLIVDTSSQEYKNECMWMAPEVLRSKQLYGSSKEADIYSYAIIMQEILTREAPFALEIVYLTTDEIIQKLEAGTDPPLRPSTELPVRMNEMKALLETCWAEDPKQRPNCQAIRSSVKRIATSLGETGNLLDNMMRRMEMYANNLEKMVEEKTEELREEKKRSEELLYQILPRSVADRLKSGMRIEPEAFECVSIYFSDIVGFTQLSARSSAIEVVDFLNDLYSSFDAIIEEFDVYKVETIGDAYMVVSGLPQKNGNLHSLHIGRMSIKVLETIKEFKVRHLPNECVQIRIGLHSGPVCAGVVGLKMPRYCLFGDTVNTASRMESNGKAMMIHVSPSTKELLDQFGTFHIEPRGLINIKGKGEMYTYWLMPGNATERVDLPLEAEDNES